MTNEPGKGMKWQIHEDYVEEFIAKVNRTMSPRVKISPDQQHHLQPHHQPQQQHQQQPQQQQAPQPSPITAERYIPRNYQEDSPSRQPQIHQAYQMTSPTTPLRGGQQRPAIPAEHVTTPERLTSVTAPHTFMPMSSPAPFYRYSSITTPGSAPHERSSPPSSGAIDLAETLVEFSSPIKPREFLRRSSDIEDSPPVRNGLRSSLGDLQGVDLLRGFEKISSWREGGSSPVKQDYRDEVREEFARPPENGFGREPKKGVVMKDEAANYVHHHGNLNGNGFVPARESDGANASQNETIHTDEEMVDSQMTELK